MRIITNLDSTNNHLIQIRNNFLVNDKVIIASPFLMGNFSTFFNGLKPKSLKEIHLITTLKPKSLDQIRKVNSFQTFLDLAIIKKRNVKFRISINNLLHGKIYIFIKGNKRISAILTSANFTDSGLSTNHEWGIEITDETLIAELEKTLIDSLEVDSITKQKIKELAIITKKFLEKNPESEKREIDLDLTHQLKFNIRNIHLYGSTKFWLKPIGVTGYPVEPNRKFSSKNYDLHFSKIRPSGVKRNDLVICYGVGTTKILSIYRATSLPKLTSGKKIKVTDWYSRWPWYIKSSNMTPIYGGKWSSFDFKIGQLATDYLQIVDNEGILANGSNSLGGLKWGKDKLQLSPGFARYIIELIYSVNK